MSRIPRPVWLLGWASLLTDAATEMMYPLLPVYLSRVLHAGPASLGLIEGVAEGVNSLLKMASGRLADYCQRRKPIVIAGYVLSSAIRPFVGLTTSWWHVLTIRAVDRTGKGIRGAPRDAMLAQFATPTTRGRIFGFHRAMDHAGAVLGPLFAAVFLYLRPGQYRALFACTAVPGALAVWVLTRVKESGESAKPEDEAGERRSPFQAPEPRAIFRMGFPSFLLVLLVFSLGNSSDAFLLLRLSTVLGSDVYLPLLWAGLHVVKAGLSVYGGALSDRVGRKRLIVGGWLVYSAIYAGFATLTSTAALVTCFLAYGAYFGLVEGTEKALVADLAPVRRHGTAFGWYNATLGVGALLASVVFGVVYERWGAPTAFALGAVLSVVASMVLGVLPIGAAPQARVAEP